MAKTSLLKRQAEVYLRIAHRQLGMAKALLEKGFYEGAIFHCYHAFEAACSAGVANRGQRVPLRHKAKFNKFRHLYPGLPFSAEFAAERPSLRLKPAFDSGQANEASAAVESVRLLPQLWSDLPRVPLRPLSFKL